MASSNWKLKLKSYMPKSLFGRAFLIIMLPVVIMQILVVWIFFNAHWQTVTASLSDSVAGDINMALTLYEQSPSPERLHNLDAMMRPDLKLSIAYDPADSLPNSTRKAFFSTLDKTLGQALSSNLDNPFWFDTTRYAHFVDIRVRAADGKILKFIVPRERVFASTGYIFLFWLVLATLILSAVSIIFIKNQARPIVELAEAAENFGKGRSIGKFKPSGAKEVRQAGHAFLEMQRRIGRHLDQRTTLLAGVSHDLRTPLTRLKLHLALEKDTAETREARKDVETMQDMLDGYLDFAKDTSEEQRQKVDISSVLKNICKKSDVICTQNLAPDMHILARKTALQRAFGNLIGNALTYADHIRISSTRTEKSLTITIDDDGPGIPASRRNDALKPFVRLDPARNQNTKGVGLGLSIAKDIIQAHGGTLSLGDSPLGGLRCHIVLPL